MVKFLDKILGRDTGILDEVRQLLENNSYTIKKHDDVLREVWYNSSLIAFYRKSKTSDSIA